MMTRRGISGKIHLLDQYIHELIKRFYLRPSLDGAAGELSSSELFACNLLGRRRRCTMTELAQECGLALSSMTGVIDRLVAKNCVRRTRDEEDRRKVFVDLDRKGKKVYQDLLEGEMEMIIRMMDTLAPGEQDSLLRVLGKATASIEG
ncbi:MAG: MarR family transcriptional regulator [Candidatus Binatia bacterium]|nr:MarR family transcriptional regulator [Candidatus Binatia bacterium]